MAWMSIDIRVLDSGLRGRASAFWFFLAKERWSCIEAVSQHFRGGLSESVTAMKLGSVPLEGQKSRGSARH